MLSETKEKNTNKFAVKGGRLENAGEDMLFFLNLTYRERTNGGKESYLPASYLVRL